jgi:hypothetical protein
MKKVSLFLFPIILFIVVSCRPKTNCDQLLHEIRVKLESGDLRETVQLAGSIKKFCSDNNQISREADSLAQIAERTGLDFNVTEEQIIKQIEMRSGNFTREYKADWEKKGWLEWRLIDGNKMYFNRAASNLLLLRKFHENKEERLKDTGSEPNMIFRVKHTGEVYKTSDNQSKPVVPVNMKIIYTITVHPGAVPEGEIIRCWLPWPKASHLRQQNVKLLSTSGLEYIIAPDSAIHSSIYMEEVSEKGVPAVFQISFRYQSNAQYFNMAGCTIVPYDKKSEDYKKYTSEQHPQLCFTENVKHLADSITAKNDDPATIVKKIYYWFKYNIPWTGALEYSVMPVIPEYVIKNRRGDCGMQTFLFMSMLRYKGVPVRWQSGWMVPPGAENLHDWCEVYYEGTGWVPVDVSYDLQQSDTEGIKEFYLSGIDSYRLIVNDGVAGPLHPEKLYLRSEPYDFQRGEVEWRGGNLYFDKWDYDMKIEYIK